MTNKQKQAKVAKVMREFKAGTLKGSDKKPVTNRKQAIAIALSEAGMSMKGKSDAYVDAYIDTMMCMEVEEPDEESMEEEMDGSCGKKTLRGDAESFSPPLAVRAAARRGLELRKKYGKGGLTTQEAGKQGIGSGVARATSLANGESVSYETIKRMAAFFSRHEKNKSGGEDDAGFVAWQLWGSDAGRTWANRVIKMVEKRQSNE